MSRDIDFNEFVEEILRLFSFMEFTKDMSNITNRFFQMVKENKLDINAVNAKDGTKTNHITSDISRELEAILDDSNNKSNGRNDLFVCSSYNDGSYKGLLKQSICHMTSTLQDPITLLSIHLLFNNYQQCKYILSTLSNSFSVPIISQNFNSLIEAINSYINEKPDIETSKSQLAKAYVKLCFCLA